MFDQYWNSRKAMPVPAFAKMPDDPAAALQKLRSRIQQTLADAKKTRYGEAVVEDIGNYMETTAELFTWAPYELAYDSPDKADKKLAADATKITSKLAEVIAAAESELIIVSPYFVPRKNGVAYLRSLIDRGISVTIVTNSLAANNHGIVHSGYMGYRKDLLKAGVNIYEVKATASVAGVERGGSGASLATLHTKSFLVDRERLFVGSFNWDPRSANINTELGVIMDSAVIGSNAWELVQVGLEKRTYEVTLDDQGNLQWVDRSGFEPRIITKEPDTTWWRRTKAQLGRLLPVRGQL
jgi:putative cardiolipin synthase